MFTFATLTSDKPEVDYEDLLYQSTVEGHKLAEKLVSIKENLTEIADNMVDSWYSQQCSDTWKGRIHDIMAAKREVYLIHWRQIAEMITGEDHCYKTPYKLGVKGEKANGKDS